MKKTKHSRPTLWAPIRTPFSTCSRALLTNCDALMTHFRTLFTSPHSFRYVPAIMLSSLGFFSQLLGTLPAVAQEMPYALSLVPSTPRSTETFVFGESTNPDGHTVAVDSKGLLMDGEPVIPVMGEMHFSRVPETEWRDELLKMKSGGITVVATYIFWNHHEGQPNVWDWAGRKDLRRFVQTAQDCGLQVVIRVGPFCHGEAYLGGIPDWLVALSRSDKRQYALRSLAPGFMAEVKELYEQIFQQIEGLQWKDGGPIIGMQIENECRGPWPYMHALKEMAVTIGFDLPFMTRTGWPRMNGVATYGELLPLYGDYADGFWDRDLTDMPGDYRKAFDFRQSRISTVIATETFSKEELAKADENDDAHARTGAGTRIPYPYFTCELGGGMMPSYHRRIHIFGTDALALAVCKVGSGSNLPGYYMYHGGTNPDNDRHPMNEMQCTPFTNYNDLPHKTYDFQAPLGEMGQTGDSYHPLRLFHTFLSEWGAVLNGMDPQFPADRRPLRWAVRSDGQSGFVFVSNYLRLSEDKCIDDVRFCLRRTDGTTLTFPRRPVSVPAGASFVLPFGLTVCEGTDSRSAVIVDYATAQPFCRLADGTVVFVEIASIQPEISVNGNVHRPKLNKPFRLCGQPFLVLSAEKAKQAYKTADGIIVYLKDAIPLDDNRIQQWTTAAAKVTATPLCDAQPPRAMRIGAAGVAEQPNDDEWNAAASWLLTWDDGELAATDDNATAEDQFLQIDYRGDCARIYADGKLVEDNFWNGRPMLVRASDLRRADGTPKRVELHILPLSKAYPIYLQPAQHAVLDASDDPMLSLDGIHILCRRNSVRAN